MDVTHYSYLPPEVKQIRIDVFMDEQGFVDEFDDIDDIATHFLLWDGNTPVATCRVFWKEDLGTVIFGRLAVIKSHRGKGLGGAMIRHAEAFAKRHDTHRMILHAQCRAQAFYEKQGFSPFGEQDDEEGCPHVWMEKAI